MFNGKFYKWEKLEANAWGYEPSILEEKPIICRVVPASKPEPARAVFYRAELGRQPDPFIDVGSDRDRITRARDARGISCGRTTATRTWSSTTEKGWMASGASRGTATGTKGGHSRGVSGLEKRLCSLLPWILLRECVGPGAVLVSVLPRALPP